jgi:hypothetical protein
MNSIGGRPWLIPRLSRREYGPNRVTETRIAVFARFFAQQQGLSIRCSLPIPRVRFIFVGRLFSTTWHGLPGHSAELSRSPRENTAKPVLSVVEGMAVPLGIHFLSINVNLAPIPPIGKIRLDLPADCKYPCTSATQWFVTLKRLYLW